METHTSYMQVPCSEPPKESGWYITNKGELWFSYPENEWGESDPISIDWWLEKREDVVVMTKEGFEEIQYWKTRCKLSEQCIEESPCDPDITEGQIIAHKKYHNFIKEFGMKS